MTIVCAVFLIGKIYGSGNPEVKVEWPSLSSISVIHFWNVCLLFPQSSARLEVLVLQEGHYYQETQQESHYILSFECYLDTSGFACQRT